MGRTTVGSGFTVRLIPWITSEHSESLGGTLQSRTRSAFLSNSVGRMIRERVRNVR